MMQLNFDQRKLEICFWRRAAILILVVLLPGCGGRGPIPEPPFTNKIGFFQKTWDSEANDKWQVAEPLAEICEKAYQPLLNATGAFRIMGFDKTQEVRSGSMHAYVVSSGDVMVIAFRGTEAGDVGDWIADLNVFPISTQHGRMPRGFADAYGSLKSAIHDAVKSRPKYLWITGHSLGGALAIACAKDLNDEQAIKVFGVITFGQPRIADDQLARHIGNALKGRYARFVNGADIVTRLPPLPYVHCGSIVRFRGDEILRFGERDATTGASVKSVETTTVEDPPLTQDEFNRLKAQLKARKVVRESPFEDRTKVEGIFSPLTDHPMAAYHKRIREMLNKP